MPSLVIVRIEVETQFVRLSEAASGEGVIVKDVSDQPPLVAKNGGVPEKEGLLYGVRLFLDH